MEDLITDVEYQTFLTGIKQRYRNSQLKAAYAVNHEMIQFYWHLGKQIIEQQVHVKWGSKFLSQFSKDMQTEFPGTGGFSVRNLKDMRKFAELYPEIGQQLVAQLPWGHIIVLMEQVKNSNARNWYANSVKKNGTSRSVLTIQIEQELYEREGKNSHKVTKAVSKNKLYI